jgi:hypothetical protein
MPLFLGILIPTITLIFSLFYIVWLVIKDVSGHPPANPPIPGFVVPKYGAYHQRKVAEDHAYWEENFKRALPK